SGRNRPLRRAWAFRQWSVCRHRRRRPAKWPESVPGSCCTSWQASSELQGDGAAEYVDITIGSDTGFVTVVVNEGEVALLQLLVLVAQVEAYRVGQEAGAVVSGTDTKANHQFVGIQVVELRIT